MLQQARKQLETELEMTLHSFGDVCCLYTAVLVSPVQSSPWSSPESSFYRVLLFEQRNIADVNHSVAGECLPVIVIGSALTYLRKDGTLHCGLTEKMPHVHQMWRYVTVREEYISPCLPLCNIVLLVTNAGVRRPGISTDSQRSLTSCNITLTAKSFPTS